ncbi:MAG: 30S ribosomal protein S6 [Candidatus Latescibacteria bacterium]|jgi:small subunit ribosomal protein S6|nr:30S ribosomal protein S6 [Candidatus Latescibacterota bacterium]MBT4140322.1 30S ribosomal protein S6 [Candidatus Latescibacterota bacterium]MBT5832867.1 30S ribosomal protein S6 [Candidatus Latescibacterota bacterium]
MPKDYEMTLIVDIQLAEGSVDEAVTRYEALVGEQGTLINVDRWGSRKLAYDIRKRQQGDYTFFQFQAEPEAISEVDRACRLDAGVLRHMIITVPGGFEADEPEADPVESDVDQDKADEAGSDSDDNTEEVSE